MTLIQAILNWGPVNKVRRNHALEHATLHILAKKHGNQYLGGHSDYHGMRVIGNVPTEEVQLALDEALARLRSGEKQLAYHPNCGTNYSTAGILAGVAAWLGTLGSGKSVRSKAARLPLVVMLVTSMLIFARPLGPFLQQHITTNGDPGTLKVYEIHRHDFANFVFHRILTVD